MSLVNDMLRDLEQRGQKTPQGPLTDSSVQPVQQAFAELPPRRKPWPWIVVMIALLVGFTVLAWQQWKGMQAPRMEVAVSPASVSVNSQEPVAAERLPQVEPTVEPVEVSESEVALTSRSDDPQPSPNMLVQEQVMAQLPEAEPAVEPHPSLQRIDWKSTARGGELTLAFSAPVNPNILQQSADTIRLALPDTALEDTLPLLPASVVRSFDLHTDDQQLVLSLRTVRSAQFEMQRDTQQLQLAISLVPDAEPEPVSVTEVKSSDTLEQSVAKVTPIPVPSEVKQQALATTPAKSAPAVAKQSKASHSVAETKATAPSKPESKPKAEPTPAPVVKQADKTTHVVAKTSSKPAVVADKAVADKVAVDKPAQKAPVQENVQEKQLAERPVKSVKPVPTKASVPTNDTRKKPQSATVAGKAADAKPEKTQYSDKQAAAKARELLQGNQVSEAHRLLTKQLNAAPEHRESRVLLASLQLAAGKLNAADTLVDAGFALSPLDSGLKKVKARILLAQEQPDVAATLLGTSQPSVEADPEYHELWAVALQQNNQAEDAIRVYYQLLQRDSKQARWWVGLGYSLELAARIDESRKAYKSSLQIPDLDKNLKHFVTQRLEQLAQR